MRLVRKRGLPGGTATWDVVDHPFRVVALPGGWLVVGVNASAQDALARHDLLGQPFATRAAAMEALGGAVAGDAV